MVSVVAHHKILVFRHLIIIGIASTRTYVAQTAHKHRRHRKFTDRKIVQIHAFHIYTVIVVYALLNIRLFDKDSPLDKCDFIGIVCPHKLIALAHTDI